MGWIRDWLKNPWFRFSINFSWTGYTNHEALTMSDKYPNPQAFIAAIKPAAQAIEAKFTIPWMFAATQAAHESRYGNSLLTQAANNLFGITGDTWMTQGKPVYMIDTKEYNAAKEPYWEKRPFRKYASFQESLEDWASVIIRLYPKAHRAAIAGDFKGFAEGLQEGGYATDPQYAMQLQNMHTALEALA